LAAAKKRHHAGIPMLTGDVRIVKNRFCFPNFAPWRLCGKKSESGKEDSPAKHALSDIEGAQRRQGKNK
jgi:hypothetical protein